MPTLIGANRQFRLHCRSIAEHVSAAHIAPPDLQRAAQRRARCFFGTAGLGGCRRRMPRTGTDHRFVFEGGLPRSVTRHRGRGVCRGYASRLAKKNDPRARMRRKLMMGALHLVRHLRMARRGLTPGHTLWIVRLTTRTWADRRRRSGARHNATHSTQTDTHSARTLMWPYRPIH